MGEAVENIVSGGKSVLKEMDGLIDDIDDEVVKLCDKVQEVPVEVIGEYRRYFSDLKGPDYPNAAHHIVAGSSPKAAEARAILQKYGVDINDAANGIFLPTVRDVAEGAYHPSLHTDSYYRKVTELLSSAKSKDDVLDILEDIADQLQ